MNTVLAILLILILIPLSALLLYQWFLAVASFFFRSPAASARTAKSHFVILIPAHDEEVGIGSSLESIGRLNYSSTHYHVVVVADRCTDDTATIARKMGAQCFERSDGQSGKGAALAWGIQQARNANIPFDAVVIVDADTVVDRNLLSAFDEKLESGHEVQQGYNYLSNPWSTPFTRIIAVTSTLRNGRYYTGKTVLGIPGMLTGTGMCISAEVLNRHGWTAFSVGEDWEFSVQLLLAGDSIYFNPAARAFARESQGLKQASRQRLRWASGRYAIMGEKLWALISTGVRNRSYSLVDEAVTLLAPNYSSQASLALLCLVGSWLVASDPLWTFVWYWSIGAFITIAGYFVLGVLSTEAPGKALAGLALVPIFLPWRMTIELLGMMGYGRRHWGRMSRGKVSS
ncbi:glycosyltransferase family 2 protein [Nitrospira japonica]|nr:glycosyltransferase family 2 protein [Nitrospira japonica]